MGLHTLLIIHTVNSAQRRCALDINTQSTCNNISGSMLFNVDMALIHFSDLFPDGQNCCTIHQK